MRAISNLPLIRVGYLGPEGTFTHVACQHWLKTEGVPVLELVPCTSLTQLFDQLYVGHFDAIFSPIENTIEGPVNDVFDQLIQNNQATIERVYDMSICQSLLVFDPTVDTADITHIVSMPHAYAQCHQFVAAHCPKAVFYPASSTAGAVQMVQGHTDIPNATTAIIGHHRMTDIYPVHSRVNHIHDRPNNHTQFALIRINREAILPLKNPTKGLVVISIPKDQPGGLLSILTIFKSINLTKIMSRPKQFSSKTSELDNFSYNFFIEFSVSDDPSITDACLNKAEQMASYFNFLGYYTTEALHD